MIYDYVLTGLVCLTALLIAGTLLGLPLYRRYVTLTWLETAAETESNPESRVTTW